MTVIDETFNCKPELVKSNKVTLIEGADFLESHWHDEYELILVTAGKIVCEVDSNAIEVTEYECLLINPQQFHQIKLQGTDDAQYHSISWLPVFLESHYLDQIETDFFAPLTSGKKMFKNTVFSLKELDKVIGVAIETDVLLKLIDRKPAAWEFNLKIILLSVWYSLFASNWVIERKTLESSRQLKSINMAKQYVIENYSKSLSLSKVAEHVSLNPDYFGRIFKKTMGVSLIEFITEVRINQAEYLLKTSNKAVSNICFDVGFNNLSYFSKKFKDMKGLPPTQVRSTLAYY